MRRLLTAFLFAVSVVATAQAVTGPYVSFQIQVEDKLCTAEIEYTNCVLKNPTSATPTPTSAPGTTPTPTVTPVVTITPSNLSSCPSYATELTYAPAGFGYGYGITGTVNNYGEFYFCRNAAAPSTNTLFQVLSTDSPCINFTVELLPGSALPSKTFYGYSIGIQMTTLSSVLPIPAGVYLFKVKANSSACPGTIGNYRVHWIGY